MVRVSTKQPTGPTCPITEQQPGSKRSDRPKRCLVPGESIGSISFAVCQQTEPDKSFHYRNMASFWTGHIPQEESNFIPASPVFEPPAVNDVDVRLLSHGVPDCKAGTVGSVKRHYELAAGRAGR